MATIEKLQEKLQELDLQKKKLQSEIKQANSKAKVEERKERAKHLIQGGAFLIGDYHQQFFDKLKQQMADLDLLEIQKYVQQKLLNKFGPVVNKKEEV